MIAPELVAFAHALADAARARGMPDDAAALDDAAAEAAAHPERFTPWFRLIAADAGFRARLVAALDAVPAAG